MREKREIGRFLNRASMWCYLVKIQQTLMMARVYTRNVFVTDDHMTVTVTRLIFSSASTTVSAKILLILVSLDFLLAICSGI